MKRFVVFAAVLIAAAGFAYAQEVGASDPSMSSLAGNQALAEVSVERFELEGSWYSTMSRDQGYTTARLFQGGPDARQPIPGEAGMDIPDDYVLGVRVDFLRRGYNSFTVRAVRPIHVTGITRSVSVWVAGRNLNHELRLLVRDMNGRQHSVHMGYLNFLGWKQLTAVIPHQPMDGRTGIVQWSHRPFQREGLEIVGFLINTDPMEAYGSYYIYFDDMRAITDLASLVRDPDDMADGW
ncbi:MAG: flagellar filament outer layer protein FlaA [Treponema sp.]|nr:flagellar filament outer layer protein FlaA [Treponema sp.]